MSRFLRLAFNMLLVLGLYAVLSYFNLVSWYLILGFVLLIAVYFYFQIRITDNELYFEFVCNTTMYLRRINTSKDAKKDTDVYHLGLAYAAMYQGDVTTMEVELDRVDDSRLPNPERQLPIYIRIRARGAYEDKDRLTLEELLERVQQLHLESLEGYITTLILLLNDQYEDAIILLKDIIPKETIRLYIIELEYILALAYRDTGQTEDALAILEFIVKRGYGIIQTDLAYETYINIKDNETEKSISQ